MKDVGFLRILPRQIVLMNVSLEQLLSLSYIEQFLFRKDISHLKQIRSIIERKIMPAITAQSNYQNTFNYMQKIEKNMFEVSSSTVDHSAMLQKIVQINIAVFRNIFGFAMLNFGYRLSSWLSEICLYKTPGAIFNHSPLFSPIQHDLVSQPCVFSLKTSTVSNCPEKRYWKQHAVQSESWNLSTTVY